MHGGDRHTIPHPDFERRETPPDTNLKQQALWQQH